MKAKDIRSMTIDEIDGKLTELKDKLFKQKIQASLGQADSPFKIKDTKKNIAKLLTILTEKRNKDGKE